MNTLEKLTTRTLNAKNNRELYAVMWDAMYTQTSSKITLDQCTLLTSAVKNAVLK